MVSGEMEGKAEGPGRDTESTARSLLALAREHQRAGRIDEAEAAYRRLIETAPDLPLPRHQLGLLYARTGRPARAIEHFAAATRLSSENPAYFNDLGHACAAAGRMAEAKAAYCRAIALRPDAADGHFNLGNLHRQQGELAAAAAAYRRAIAAAPDALHAYINLGVTLQDLAAFDEARQILEQATAMAPGSFEAHFNLGVILDAQRRLEDAAAAYRRAIAIRPDAAGAHLNLGTVLQNQHRLDAAIACYQRAAALDPTLAQAHVNLGAALHESGDAAGSLAAIRRALELEPSDAQSHANLALTLLELEDPEGAELAFRRALALDPALTAAKAHFAILLQRIGKLDEARRLLDYTSLLETRRIERVAGWPTPTAFTAALAQYVYGHPTLQRDPPARATQHGSQTLEILNCDDPPIAALQRFFEAAVADYLARLSAADMPFAVSAPPAWKLHGWAVVLRAGGYQLAHFHPAAVVSGVYYVQIPGAVKSTEAGEAGFIKFGDPYGGMAGSHAPSPPLTATVKPEEGKLILFPAYFWHHTIPFEDSRDRICIAFDVIPDDRRGGRDEAEAMLRPS